MSRTPALIACSLALLTAADLTAQTRRTLPPGFGVVPGNSKHTYPFGRPTGGVQILVDRAWLTSQVGTVLAARFRADDDPANAFPAYAKSYELRAATTTTPAAAMVNDPIANLAGAAETTVFSGTVNLPSSGPVVVAPTPFAVAFPFSAPYQYDGTAGNGLILTVRTTDASSPPGNWALDAATLRTTATTGLVEQKGSGCANAAGATLGLAVDATQLVVGGSFTGNLTSSAPGAFPVAVGLFGITNANIDLGVLGMPKCGLHVLDSVAQVRTEIGGVYQPLLVPIPTDPNLEGLGLAVQALGWAQPSAGLAGSVTSPSFGVRVGSLAGPPVNGQSIFSIDLATWYIGRVGTYMPIIELEGVFP